MKSREQAAVIIDAALADDPLGTFPHHGTFNFSENRIDPDTDTLRLRAELNNPKPAGSALGLRVFTPGLFMRVRLLMGEPRIALVLPEKALEKAMVNNQGVKSVFVILPIVSTDPKHVGTTIARRKDVKIGASQDGFRKIESGLVEGEKSSSRGCNGSRPRRRTRRARRSIRWSSRSRSRRPSLSKHEPRPAVPASAVAKETATE